MGMRINTNVAALSAMRNLQNTTLGLNKTLERLSTGLRINRAADDAAGLAISEGLKSQIRGLGVAVRNANDAISVVQTAEGAMAEQTNIVQRLRELAIQASNGTLGDNDRASLQKEVDALLGEFDRIAQQTSFNGVALLNGYFGTKDIQIGDKKNQTIELGMVNARSNSMGAVASEEGVQRVGVGNLAVFDDIAINGTSIADTDDDGVSFQDGDLSAIAFANAINAISGTTGVTATVEATVFTAFQAFSAGSFSYTSSLGELTLNGISITGTGSTITDAVTMINQFSAQTGVTASNENSYVVLTAADGRNIDFGAGAGATAGDVAQLAIVTGVAVSGVHAASVKLTSDDNFTVAQGTGGGTATATVFGVTSGAYSTSSTTSISTMTLLTQDDAANAIEILDNTLRQLNSRRATLGATQNRLESTIKNLSTTVENLSAANSRVRDADIAEETGNLTKMQILQQAGISVLAQANVSTQAVLSLLQ